MRQAWTALAGLGVAMVRIFMYIRFAPSRKLGRALALSQWADGGAALVGTRAGVSINRGPSVHVLLVTWMCWKV